MKSVLNKKIIAPTSKWYEKGVNERYRLEEQTDNIEGKEWLPPETFLAFALFAPLVTLLLVCHILAALCP